jgi:hypothetical protein
MSGSEIPAAVATGKKRGSQKRNWLGLSLARCSSLTRRQTYYAYCNAVLGHGHRFKLDSEPVVDKIIDDRRERWPGCNSPFIASAV